MAGTLYSVTVNEFPSREFSAACGQLPSRGSALDSCVGSGYFNDVLS